MPSRRGLRLLALPGMELCTREEVHIVCVFPDLERAGAFQEEVYRSLGEARNDPAIFGRQLYLDTDDRVLGEESRLLAGATAIGVYEVPALVERYGGAAWPAHIDRPSFSLLSNLGLWDPGLGFSLAEVSRNCPPDFMPGRRDLRGVPTITAVTPTIWSRSQIPASLWRSPPGPGRRCWPGCAGAARERAGSAARKARPRLTVPVRNRESHGKRMHSEMGASFFAGDTGNGAYFNWNILKESGAASGAKTSRQRGPAARPAGERQNKICPEFNLPKKRVEPWRILHYNIKD